MDSLTPMDKMKLLAAKYKFPLLVLAIGMVFMLLPKAETPEAPPAEQITEEFTLEERLEQILARIEGAGELRLILTEDKGSETLYQTDTRENQTDTVLITDSQHSETGLIRRTDPPEYLGAVVVCQGADDPKVCLALTEAVSCATGLGADQISIVKMK